MQRIGMIEKDEGEGEGWQGEMEALICWGEKSCMLCLVFWYILYMILQGILYSLC